MDGDAHAGARMLTRRLDVSAARRKPPLPFFPPLVI